jgi:threonyl-tRNA synthetase
VETGEAAFYGPKLDFMVKDALGRQWQLGTIQVDYNLPERFDLQYKGSDNEQHQPVMIHRAPFGSLERFVAILLEHTGGNFPLWLVPNQVNILCVSEKYKNYALKVLSFLENHEIRALVDDRNETIGKKIRESEITKVPYMIVIGEKEAKENNVSLRKHNKGNLGVFSLISVVEKLNDEIKSSQPAFEV